RVFRQSLLLPREQCTNLSCRCQSSLHKPRASLDLWNRKAVIRPCAFVLLNRMDCRDRKRLIFQSLPRFLFLDVNWLTKTCERCIHELPLHTRVGDAKMMSFSVSLRR